MNDALLNRRREMMQVGGVKLELPVGYTELYGISMQMFWTPVPSTGKSRIETNILFTRLSGNVTHYGARRLGDYYGMFAINNRFDWLGWGTSSYSLSLSTNTWYHLEHGWKDGQAILIVGNNSRTFINATFEVGDNIYLFGGAGGPYAGSRPAMQRVGLFIDDELKAYYIPYIKDSDGSIGMYECFTQTFIVGDSNAVAYYQ